MKKFKNEIIIAILFYLGMVGLFWESLGALQDYLPYGLLSLGVILLVSVFFVKRSAHETYAPKYAARALVSCLLGICIILGVVTLLHKNRFATSFDVTKDKVNTLTQETLSIIKALSETVEVICIPDQNLSDVYCSNIRELVNLYARNSDKIVNLGILDMRNPTFVDKVRPEGFSRLVLMTSNNKSEVVGPISEGKLTNAILNLLKFKKAVYFLTGHGEPGLSASSSGRSYQETAELLKTRTYDSFEWDYTRGQLPQEAQLLVMGSNTISYGPEVDEIVSNFLARGGRLILTVNPFKELGLSNTLARIGVKLNDDLLVLNRDTPFGKQIEKQNFTNPPILISNFSVQSPITSILAQSYQGGAYMMVEGARSLSLAPLSPDAPYKIKPTPLMDAVLTLSAPMSPSDRAKLDPTKPLPPMKIALQQGYENRNYPVGLDVEITDAQKLLNPSSEDKSVTSEVVIFAFDIVGPYNKPGTVNSFLIPLSVSHLYRDQELISLPQAQHAPKQFNLSKNPGAYLLFFAALLPILSALGGLFVWLRRRAR
jgi:hypothetical protein